LALAAGAAIPIALVIGWVLISPWRGEMPGLFREIRLYGSGTPWRSLLQFKTGVFFILPFVPLIIRGLLSLRAPRVADAGEWEAIDEQEEEESPQPMAEISTIAVFAVVWAALEITAVILQRRLYGYHFLVLMPAAVVIFALWPRPNRQGLWPILVAVAPLAILSLVYSVPGYRSLRSRGMSPVSRYVLAHTMPGDVVWADPAARLLLETGRRPGSRLQMTFYLVNHDDAPRYFTDILLGDFETRRPKYLILPANWAGEMRHIATETPCLIWRPKRQAAYLRACNRISDYIQSRYELETTVDGERVYHRVAGPLAIHTAR
jgi:hypothetical protein